MVCAIVFVDDRPVSFRHGMLHRGRGRAKVTLERRPLLEGEYLLLTLPQGSLFVCSHLLSFAVQFSRCGRHPPLSRQTA